MEKLITLKGGAFTMQSATKLMESLDVSDKVDSTDDSTLFSELAVVSDGDKCDYVLGNGGSKILLHIVYGGYGMFKTVELALSGRYMRAGLDKDGLLHVFVVRENEIWQVKQLSSGGYNFSEPERVTYTHPLHFVGVSDLIIHNFPRASGLGFALGVVSQTTESKAFWVSYRHWDGSSFDNLISAPFSSPAMVFTGATLDELSLETLSSGYASYSIARRQVDKSYPLALPQRTDKVRQILPISGGVLLALVEGVDGNCVVVDIRLDDAKKTAAGVELTPRGRYTSAGVYCEGIDKAVLLLNGTRMSSTTLIKEDGVYVSDELFPLDNDCHAPCFNSNPNCMRVYYLQQGCDVVHQLENQAGTTWVENTLQTPKPGEIRRLPCYSTELTFTDPTYGTALADMEVTLWAESRTYIETSESIFLVDNHKNKASLRTDGLGKVTLLQYSSSLDVPVIYASLPQKYLDSDHAIVISQFAGVNERFSSINADQLLAAEQTDSMAGTKEPFLPEQYRNKSTAEELSKGMREIMKIKPAENAPVAIARLGNLKNFSRIEQRDDLPSWSMDFESGQPRFTQLTSQEAAVERKMMYQRANRQVAAPKWLKSIADFFRSIVKGFVSLCKMIIDGVKATFEFILDGIRMVLDVIIKVVQEVLHVIETLLSKLAIIFLVVFAWLASLFMWGDVMRCKQAIREMLSLGLDYLQQSVGGLKEKLIEQLGVAAKDIDSTFEEIIKKLDPSKQVGTYKNESVPAQDPDVAFQMSNDPLQKKFFNSSTLNCSMSDMAVFLDAKDKSSLDDVMELLKRYLAEVGDNAACQNAIKYFEDMFSGGIDNFFTSLVSGILSALQGVISLVMSTISQIASALFDIASMLFEKLRELMTATIRIPFFTSFYKVITGNELTLLDLISTLIALPMTLVHKLLEGGAAPLKDDAELATFLEQAKTAFSPNNLMQRNKPPKLLSSICSYVSFISGTVYYIFATVLDALEETEISLLTWSAITLEAIWFLSCCPAAYPGNSQLFTWYMWGYFCMGCILDIGMTIINKRYIDADKEGRLLTALYGLGHMGVAIGGITGKAIEDYEFSSELFASLCEMSKPLSLSKPEPGPPVLNQNLTLRWSTWVVMTFDVMAVVTVLTCGIVGVKKLEPENPSNKPKLLLA